MGLLGFSVQKDVSKRSGKGLLNSSLLAMGALVLSGQAGAATETAPVETAPDGFKAADTIKNYQDAKVLADGSVELTLSGGETVTFAAGDVAIVGGQVFVAETAVVAAGLTLAGAGISTAALLGAGAAAIAGGAALAGGSDGPGNAAPEVSGPAAASVAEGETQAFQVSASDANSDALTYTLSGTDAAAFEINAATGAVTFSDAPDFEAPIDAGSDNVYNVTVTASDGSISDSQAVAITVTDVNDVAPVFTSAAAGSVIENAPTSSAVYVAAATDADSSAVTYALSGEDATLFNINAATGAVTFAASPDFETPGDADADNIYNVVVTASDGLNETDQAVAITVTDANEAPVLTADAMVSAAENQTAALTATSSDVDGDVVTYSLSGDDAALFAIDASGVVTFVDAPNFETPGDADGDNVYDITVTATDGTLTDSQDIAITVTDENEAPVLTANAAVNAPENQTAALTIAAADVDGDTVTYSLSGADAGLFAVSTAGVVTFVNAPDFEAPADADGDNVYDVTVTATDGTLTDSQDIAITVTDVNEAPVLTADTAVNAVENQTASLTVASSDVDGDALSYSLSGADAALFAVSSAGVVTFAASPDFEAPADADGDNVYDVTVTASDGTLTDSQAVAITVTDINDVSPVFTSAAAGSIAENAPTSGAVYVVAATDADSSAVTYALSGEDAALFNINATSGAVTFAASPDFEAPADGDADNVYNVVVTASDGLNSTDQAVEITVTDVNEAPSLVADAAVSVTENQTAVLTATSSDVDGDVVTYSLSGDDAALFAIDASGVVTFVEAPNFEAPGDANGDNVYDVTVVASDGTLTDSQDVAITVTDENEAPVLTAASTVSVLENQTAVLTANTSDVDGDTITYSLSGDDAAAFVIDAAGVLSLAGAPDFEAPGDSGNDGVYNVTITASDAEFSDSQDVAVTVTDANEAPSLVADAAVSVTENQTAALTATSSDVDGDVVTYSLSGDDAALFAIDASGVVTFVDAPNFETPGDADGDNVYDLTVNASDGDLTDSQDVAITVTDENEAPVFTSAEAVTVDEGNFDVYTASATADAGETLTYAIVGGADYNGPNAVGFDVNFVIDSETGAVSYLGNPARFILPEDTNLDNTYEIQIAVSDGTSTTVQDVAISIADLNIAPRLLTPTPQDPNRFTEVPQIDGVAQFDISLREGLPIDLRLVSSDFIDDVTPLFFNMSGADAAAFTFTERFQGDSFIISSLTFNGVTDFEIPADADGDNVYDLTFSTSDGVNTPVLNLRITVEDLIETVLAPVFTSSAALSVDEAQTFIGNVVATDDDGPFVEYAITGGLNVGLFEIDTASGALSFAQGTLPRFDANQAPYQVEVTASDGLNETSQTISITVEDANVAPVINITGGTGFTVIENAVDVYIGGVGGTDSFDNDVLTMTFSGDDIALFDQSVFDGALWRGQAFGGLVFTDAPDFETPLDADGDNIYEFTLTISDGVNSVSQDYTVEVTDIIETAAAPVFVTGTEYSVDEGSIFVANIEAADADGPFVEYSLSGADAQWFSLGISTGELNFVFLPSTGAPVDFDRDNVFEIDVTATDGFNITTTSISITLEDINAAPLFFTDIPDQISIEENSLSRFFVEGGDRIDGDIVLASVGGVDGGLFTVVNSPNPGSEVFTPISFSIRPDFETPLDADGDGVYEIDIILSDGVNETIQSVSITVTDVFESPNAPAFTSPASFSFAENTRFVGNLVAEDADMEVVTYSIVSGDPGFFVDFSTGNLTRFNFNTLDFENPEDANGDNVYNLVVAANDGTGNITLQDVEIIVTDVDDMGPILTSSTALDFDENTVISFTPQFSDADSPGGVVSVEITRDDFGIFTIDPVSFEITASPVDFEALSFANQRADSLRVSFSDGTNVENVTLFITINDINEAPELMLASTALFADENDAAVTFPGFAVAVDPDAGSDVTLSLAGVDAPFFTIAQDGTLSLNQAFDFEAPQDAGLDGFYDVQVVASDGEFDVVASFTLTVTDLGENPPQFTSPAVYSVDEGEDLIGTLTATDIDGDSVEFFIGAFGSYDNSKFDITPDGELRLLTTPELNAGDDNLSYKVDVVVTDGTNEISQLITVDYINTNSAPSFYNPYNADIENFTVPFEAFEAGTPVYGINISDVDYNDTLSVSLTGPDADFFTLETDGNFFDVQAQFIASAALFPGVASDADGDNVFEFNVVVSDGTVEVSQAINITVGEPQSGQGLAPAVTFEVVKSDVVELTLTSDTAPDAAAMIAAATMQAPEADIAPVEALVDLSADMDMQLAADVLFMQDGGAFADG